WLLALILVCESHREGPRSCPRVRVVDSHRPLKGRRANGSETLDQTKARGVCATVRALLFEVGRLYDERGAVPMASRITHVLPEVRVDVRCRPDRNNASLVDHLVPDRDDARTLMNLVRAAVNGRHHGSRQPARNTLIVQTTILV